MSEYLYQELTSNIISCFYKVYNTLGFGFLEKVYENALLFELSTSGLFVERQKPIKVHYEDILVGEYFADLIVENKVIIEIKAVDALIEEHEKEIVLMTQIKQIITDLNQRKSVKSVLSACHWL